MLIKKRLNEDVCLVSVLPASTPYFGIHFLSTGIFPTIERLIATKISKTNAVTIWNVLCLIELMTFLDDKSFAFDFIYDHNRYMATCIAQVVKINNEYHFSGTYQVKLHDFISHDATLLYSFNELTTQWQGILIESNDFIQPGLIEMIGEEIADRYK